MQDKDLTFEQGPIRPPNEAHSLLLRLTRNCPWNQCLFCRTYKKKKFSLRTVEEIKRDIRTAGDISDRVKEISHELGSEGRVDDRVVRHIFGLSGHSDSFRSVALWMFYNTKECFLQDADNLIMETERLVEVLEFLKKTFPEIIRVTTYSRSRTVVRKTLESLVQIRKAGLDRVHIGLETGYDPLLKLIRKGVSTARHVEAGGKLIEAGVEVSEYVMPGLGGQQMWRDHALETAKVLNRINPHFIRLRSLRVLPVLPLYEKMTNGSFTPQTDDMMIAEIKCFLEALDGITSTVTSDHIINLLEEITGRLPQDRERMLEVIRRYQALDDSERLVYRVGRRAGAYRSTHDLQSDPATYGKISNLVREVSSKKGMEGLEKFITELADRYI